MAGNDVLPYIVGAVSAGVLVVVLIWYGIMRRRVHKSINDKERNFVNGEKIVNDNAINWTKL